MQDHHQLEIWQRAMDYTVAIYEFSADLPLDERFNLTRQIRKATISVPLNIAEGCGCLTNPEFARFLSYAYRSLKETETCLELCLRLYPRLSAERAGQLIDEGDRISRMTRTLMTRVHPASDIS
jgi:four helix bundle protein